MKKIHFIGRLLGFFLHSCLERFRIDQKSEGKPIRAYAYGQSTQRIPD